MVWCDMGDSRERVEHKIDRALDRHADDVSFADLELVFQRYAQGMREEAVDAGDLPTINIDDVEGWAE